MKTLVIKLEHTNLVNRTDLLDWICSPTINKGKQTERYWIINTDTQIHNTYNDPDVNYLMAMLFRTHNADYSSLMIMKNGTDYRPNSKTSGAQGESGPDPAQQTDPVNSGEVSGGESNTKIPESTPESSDSITGIPPINE